MRLFVAIELPERLRTQVADLISRAAPKLPLASWVGAPNLHLTLVFLGELADAQLPRLAAALNSVTSGRRGFRLALEGGGCFPERGRVRVAWLGFSDCPEVIDLQRELAGALQAGVGFQPESRPFNPHLTVARCAPPWPAAVGRRWAQVLRGRLGDPFPVGAVALVLSRPGRGGAVYETVQRFALGASA